ncbi:olfactory receptor 52K1-like [Pelobates fuscus]|uniref:olfactory receptor 52K1-like n=1 Tax=Pelobates fuscus TaxID=191477 RepID=UPI002FE4D44B
MANQSDSSEFILLGFPGLPENYNTPVSITLFLVYIIALFANGTVIILIVFSRRLHQPMYVIIANLALSDLLFDTITLPKIIAKYWFDDGSISFVGCIFQVFCVHYLGSLDSFIIMLMAVDRYVAIRKPLRYFSIITNKRILVLCAFFWFVPALIALATAVLDSSFPFCGNTIKSCFCNNMAVTALACIDVTFVRRVNFCLAMFVLLLPLAFIIFSYAAIIRTICSMNQSECWRKPFYTCVTHLLVIGLYFIPRIFVYVANQVKLLLHEDLSVLILCLYTFVPHMANPVIYCLRTKEIRGTLVKFFKKKLSLKMEQRPVVSVIME